MAERRTRVDFNAPESLVERADAVAEVLGVSRTRLLIDALEDELADLADDEEFRRRLSDAYYEGRAEFETVAAVLGREEATRMRLLRESFDRSLPDSRSERQPDDDAFYDGEVRTWTPDDDAATTDE
jgi:plasmid stabilization system protein ParE